MRFFRAIWNGPFYVGKLAPPIATGDAILKILETLWRGFIALVVLALGALAAVAISIYLQPQPLGEYLVATASYDLKKCKPEYPLLVSVANNSKKTIGTVSVRLEARAPGLSTNLVSYEQMSAVLDRVTQPFWSEWQCMTLPIFTQQPTNPATLIYSANVEFATEYTGPDVSISPPPLVTPPPVK